MLHSDPEDPGSGPALSRRRVLQVGAAVALAGGSVGDAVASVGTAVQSGEQPSLSWQQELGTPLDTRVRIFDDHNVAVVFTDPLADAESRVFAFDVLSGDPLWDKPFETTPWMQTHDGILYHSNRGPLAAVDPRTGERQWAVRGNFEQLAAFEGPYAAFSGDVLRATVVDLSEGTVAWRPSSASLTEVLSLVNGTVVLAGDSELAAFDVASGDRLWRLTDFPDDKFGLSIVSSWPYCFVTSVDPAVTEAIDLREGTRLWRRNVERYPLYFETSDRELVLTMDNGTVRRLNPTSGQVVWSESLTDKQVYLYFVDGELAVPVANDRIWGLSVADGSVRWDLQLDSAFPLVTREAGRLYAAGTSIRGIDSSGNTSWTEEVAGEDSLYPAASGDRLVAASGTTVYGYKVDDSSPGPSVTVSLAPSSQEIQLDETGSFDVVIAGADTGVSAYELTVESAAPDVLELVDYQLTRESGLTDIVLAEDGSTVEFNVAMGDNAYEPGDVTVASVTVAGRQAAAASLGVTVDEVVDAEEPLTAYGIEGTQGANATVVEEVGPPPIEGDDPPQDPDGDELYEDIDGNGEFSIADVQRFFQNRDADVVQNNAEFFNFSGNDPDEVTVADVQALFLQFVEDNETASASLGVEDPTELSPEELAAILADG
jgi:outer membrane protein assembly factor BamB